MTIASNKTIGGVGACLAVIGGVGSIVSLASLAISDSTLATLVLAGIGGLVGFLGFIGFILFLVAMYGFSKDYNEHKIFSNILYAIVTAIVAAVITFIVIFIIIFFTLISFDTSTFISSASLPAYSMAGSIAAGIASVIYTVFILRAFNLLSKKSEVPTFRTAALLLLAGALLTVGLGLVVDVLASYSVIAANFVIIGSVPGAIIDAVAWAMLAMAFFKIPVPATPTVTQPTFTSVSGQVKYCPNCGTPNLMDAAYCTRCGQKL